MIQTLEETLAFTSYQQLFGTTITSRNHGCNDTKIVKFKILRRQRKASSAVQRLHFRRADFSLSGELKGSIPWEAALTGK